MRRGLVGLHSCSSACARGGESGRHSGVNRGIVADVPFRCLFVEGSALAHASALCVQSYL